MAARACVWTSALRYEPSGSSAPSGPSEEERSQSRFHAETSQTSFGCKSFRASKGNDLGPFKEGKEKWPVLATFGSSQQCEVSFVQISMCGPEPKLRQQPAGSAAQSRPLEKQGQRSQPRMEDASHAVRLGCKSPSPQWEFCATRHKPSVSSSSLGPSESERSGRFPQAETSQMAMSFGAKSFT